MPSVLVIGIGNEFRGDDGVGVWVARKLAARSIPGIEIREGSGLLTDWQGYSRVWLVDAVSGGAPPGTIHRLDAHRDEIVPETYRGSTHALGITEAIELNRQIGTLPAEVMIYGLEGAAFDEGATLSPEVERAVGVIVDELADLAVQEMP